MCELFALSATEEINVSPYLREFFSHGVRNPHGWGLSWRSGDPFDDDSVTLAKEGERSVDSDELYALLARPICQKRILAHIRNSTGADTAKRNSHPFISTDPTGRVWTFIHNGILFSEGMTFPYDERTEGETDSERMFAFLMDVMDEAFLRGAPLDFTSRFDTLAGAITQLANRNRVNVMLDDGEFLYVHTNTSEPTLFFRELRSAHDAPAALFSSTKLGGPAEEDAWLPVPPNRLIAYRKGRLIRTSAPHGYGFCETILNLQRKMGVNPKDFVA